MSIQSVTGPGFHLKADGNSAMLCSGLGMQLCSFRPFVIRRFAIMSLNKSRIKINSVRDLFNINASEAWCVLKQTIVEMKFSSIKWNEWFCPEKRDAALGTTARGQVIAVRRDRPFTGSIRANPGNCSRMLADFGSNPRAKPMRFSPCAFAEGQSETSSSPVQAEKGVIATRSDTPYTI